MMRRAEEALFGRADEPRESPPSPVADAAPSPQRAPAPRRILETLVPETEAAEPALPLESEPPRRGRKPGSKNKPKAEVEAAAAGKRKRGRPRKHPEGEVRSLEITPELASAALDTMSRAAPAAAATPSPISLERASAPPATGKRPRGRPRKVAATVQAAPSAEEFGTAALASGSMSPARIIRRYGSGHRVPAGRRWTRRLRGFAHPDHAGRRSPRA